jgi:hypothetical protein
MSLNIRHIIFVEAKTPAICSYFPYNGSITTFAEALPSKKYGCGLLFRISDTGHHLDLSADETVPDPHEIWNN